MADGKGKYPVSFDGNFEGLEYEAEAKKIYRNGENIIETEVYCKGKRALVKNLTEVAAVSVLDSSAAPVNGASSIQNSPQRDFLIPVLKNLALNKLLVDDERSKIRLLVCPTMAANMESAKLDFHQELFVEPAFLKEIKAAVIGGYEQGKGNMNEYGSAQAMAYGREKEDEFQPLFLKEPNKEKEEIQNSPRETEAEKALRLGKKRARCKREMELFASLTADQMRTIDESLQLLAATRSTWLISIYKLAASTRSRELSLEYGEAEMSFESRGNTWYEIWRHPKLSAKIYESLKTNIGDLPGFIQDRLSNLARRIKENRLLKAKQT